MIRSFRWLLPILTCCISTVFAADRPWQKMTDPTVAEVAVKFRSPPSESANSVTWGWNGPMTEEVITRDLDTLHARGFRIATIEAGYRMDNAPYLSDEWFKLIRFTATEAKKRDMRLIIIDEGKYPSGFVNGKYSQERPDLQMKALALAERVQVAAGEMVRRDLAPEVVSAIAVNTENRTSRPLDISSKKLEFKAPAEGKWEVVIAKWNFSTPDTRAVRSPDGAKTKENAMGDLIDPEAAGLFIKWTHEEYKKHVGDLFGDVILALRGDEPEMTGIPWTPKIADEFQKRKGYDIRPYLASFLSAGQMNEWQRRARADYYDVWSELFATYFFDAQADWCAANGIEATSHLNNDHLMPSLVRTTGDFFRAFRKYQIPGVDVIWSQVYPGKAADFVKYPSSAAHLFGRPRALSESFAAYNATEPATYEVVNFAVNYQMVRGINLFEFMFMGSSVPRAGGRGPASTPGVVQVQAATPARGGGRGYMTDPRLPNLLTYTNRMTYILAQGKPMVQVALYMPTMSMWLGEQRDNNVTNTATLKIAGQLLAQQRDFDFVDDASLANGMKLQGDQFISGSGQSYRAVIVPPGTAISKAAIDRLQTFAKAGGKVFFLGQTPSMVVDKTFLHAAGPADLSWAVLEPSGEVNDKVLASLPKADVSLDQACPDVKVMHRKWRDADVYFFFNESDKKQAANATVVGSGRAQLWDAWTANVSSLPGATAENGTVRFPIELEPYAAKLVVVGASAVAAR